MNQRVLYLAIDVFSRGGIQRCARVQISALRSLLGDAPVRVMVVRPQPEARLQFEDPFDVTFNERRRGVLGHLHFAVRSIGEALALRPTIIWVDHVKLLPLAFLVRQLCGARHLVADAHGLELWSGLNWLESLALPQVSQFVAVSHFTANYLRDTLRIPADRISVVWHPVDAERFAPRETAAEVLPRYGVPCRPDVCYLMTLGRISVASRHNGYDRMLDVMRSIRRDDMAYLIVGDGDDRERLEQRVTDEGLAGRVYFLGNIPESDLVNVYNAADVFVLVSDRGPGRGEGLSFSLLEASSCGIPIIAGNEDGSQETVEDGVSGFLVSPRDNRAIQSAITRLVDQPELRRSMAKAARERVVRYFAYTSFREKTGAVLSRLE